MRRVPNSTDEAACSERTRELHLRYALLEALALGILANAPVVALRSLGSPTWQLALALAPSSLGIFVELYLGARMALASKIPYLQAATAVFALAVLGMTVTDDPLLFNLLHGIALLGQVLAQMALTSILRVAYPPESRGAITGRIRRWSSLALFAAALTTAVVLDVVRSGDELLAARILLGVAAAVGLLGAVVIARVPIDTAFADGDGQASGPLARALRIVREDHRFRWYLITALVASVGSLMTAPYVNAFFVKGLGLGYLATLGLSQLLPQLCAFATTEHWGRLVDRHNVWAVWTWIRSAWGGSFVLLAIAAVVAPSAPGTALALAASAKTVYGCVMGGSWILYWQLGVAHFAAPGADTSRYMSLIAMVSGMSRLIGPGIAALLLIGTGSVAVIFAAGGLTTLFSGLMCRAGLRAERREARFRSIAAFERSLEERGGGQT